MHSVFKCATRIELTRIIAAGSIAGAAAEAALGLRPRGRIGGMALDGNERPAGRGSLAACAVTAGRVLGPAERRVKRR